MQGIQAVPTESNPRFLIKEAVKRTNVDGNGEFILLIGTINGKQEKVYVDKKYWELLDPYLVRHYSGESVTIPVFKTKREKYLLSILNAKKELEGIQLKTLENTPLVEQLEQDLYCIPMAALSMRYTVNANTVSRRLAFIGVKPLRKGNMRFLTKEQFDLAEAFHEHIQSGKPQSTFLTLPNISLPLHVQLLSSLPKGRLLTKSVRLESSVHNRLESVSKKFPNASSSDIMRVCVLLGLESLERGSVNEAVA